jgi:hypothetical protein
MYITYHWNKDFDPFELGFRILKDIHYYIYDEKEHDTFFVQHAFILQWLFMKERGCFPQHHVVWSNGCASQFKSAQSWFFISRYHNETICRKLTSGCQMTWNYFATGHDKGEVDGVGALLKQELRKK